jgi:hypothetical protein
MTDALHGLVDDEAVRDGTSNVNIAGGEWQ